MGSIKTYKETMKKITFHHQHLRFVCMMLCYNIPLTATTSEHKRIEKIAKKNENDDEEKEKMKT